MAAAHQNNAKNFNNRAVKNDVMSLPNCGDISTWVGLITRWCPPLAAANFLTSHNSPSHCWNRHVEIERTENVVNNFCLYETPVVFKNVYSEVISRKVLSVFKSWDSQQKRRGSIVVVVGFCVSCCMHVVYLLLLLLSVVAASFAVEKSRAVRHSACCKKWA